MSIKFNLAQFLHTIKDDRFMIRGESKSHIFERDQVDWFAVDLYNIFWDISVESISIDHDENVICACIGIDGIIDRIVKILND